MKSNMSQKSSTNDIIKRHHKIIYDFNDVAFSETISSLIIKNFDRTPSDFSIFKNIMNDYIKTNFTEINDNINKRLLYIKNRKIVNRFDVI